MQSYFIVSCCEGVGKGKRQPHKEPKPKDKEKRSVHNTQTTEESSKEPNRTSRLQLQCSFCKKTGHLLNACIKFKVETRENKLNFVKENRLCFGCLRKGHMSSDYERRLTCVTCKKNHPTCLHEERYPKTPEEKKRREEQESTNVHKTTSYTSQGTSSANTSMSSCVAVIIVEALQRSIGLRHFGHAKRCYVYPKRNLRRA